MTGTRPQETRRTPWIAIIVVSLVACVFVWRYVASGTRGNAGALASSGGEVPLTQAGSAAGVDSSNTAIQQFAAWADSGNAVRDANASHEFTATGIRRLAAAIGALTLRDTVAGSATTAQVAALNALADKIQSDPTALSHADVVSAAFTSSAELIEGVQRRRFPSAVDEVAAMRNAAVAIDKTQPLLSQSKKVDDFFGAARTALNAMRGSATR